MESILQIRKGKQLFEGSVTYEEGDLIEAVFPDQVEVTVGEQLPCLRTSNYDTISNFEAVVLAKERNRLFLFHSPTVLEFREQRRRYPRFDMDVQGWIQYQSVDPAAANAFSYQKVDLVNLSLGGLAIRTNKPVPDERKLFFYVELYGRNRADGIVQADLQVIHERVEGPHYFYGCKIVGISSRYFHTLRKYLLQRQLAERRMIQPE
ncbi:PilZ domain-containing protein [Brevibacillus sp. WF146]|uniref:PilZ domain-containing protein n=1 Tax=Brevibacillus sp. WF146 TaxID=319501 RepID=UPI0007ECDEFA|nr:PilZ domain-containing protein [Brevibacillus sp. WF146]UYZ13015.1 PilZ domain-containing protein [Brevibacillus sp. WF146]